MAGMKTFTHCAIRQTKLAATIPGIDWRMICEVYREALLQI